MAIGLAFIYAFFGGIILNIMPCVLPVLSLKVMSLLKHKSQKEAMIAAWSYTLGVAVVFLLFAAAIVVVQSTGKNIGWGFQLQNSGFILFLIHLFIVVGLNLYGVFEFHIPNAFVPQSFLKHQGYFGEFTNGILIAVVASPCTAPFMGAAMGFAFSQSILVIIGVFCFLALGLGFPVILIAAIPALQKIIPRPGPWMIGFKEFLAFPMFATALWLLWVFMKQKGSDAGVMVLGASLIVPLCFWLRHQFSGIIRFSMMAFCIVIFGFFNHLALNSQSTPTAPTSGSMLRMHDRDWYVFKPGLAEQLRDQGKTVFVDFTAAWCITCQSNARVVFASSAVHRFLDSRSDIVLIYADLTEDNEDIVNEIIKYERSGVPLYLVFKPGEADASILPQILTPAIFMDALR
jgi:thiol:disulfide interchange protein